MIKKTNTPNATTLRAEITINRPKNTVWEVLKEIGAIQNFHPLIKKSCTITESENGMGTTRSCVLIPMGEMIEEVVEWDEGNSFVMEVIGGKMLPPYRFMTGRINLSESGNQTKVSFTFSYRLKLGLIGKMMNVLIIRPQFKKAPPMYVKGLKAYVEGLSH